MSASGTKPNPTLKSSGTPPNFTQKPRPDNTKPKHFGNITKSTIRAEQDVAPFTYQGCKIKKIAQEKPLRQVNPKEIRYFYKIDEFKTILYNNDPSSNLFNLIAGTNTKTPYDKEMPYYWEKFTKPDTEWLQLNKIELT